MSEQQFDCVRFSFDTIFISIDSSQITQFEKHWTDSNGISAFLQGPSNVNASVEPCQASLKLIKFVRGSDRPLYVSDATFRAAFCLSGLMLYFQDSTDTEQILGSGIFILTTFHTYSSGHMNPEASKQRRYLFLVEAQGAEKKDTRPSVPIWSSIRNYVEIRYCLPSCLVHSSRCSWIALWCKRWRR